MPTLLRFDLRSHDFHVTLKCLDILISVSSWIYIQSIVFVLMITLGYASLFRLVFHLIRQVSFDLYYGRSLHRLSIPISAPRLILNLWLEAVNSTLEV
eukprot:jgi/Psemu1/16966/gm1.16966_g